MTCPRYEARVWLSFVGETPPSWRGFARAWLEQRHGARNGVTLHFCPPMACTSGVAVLAQSIDGNSSPRDCVNVRNLLLADLADAFDAWTNTLFNTRAFAQSLNNRTKGNL